MEISEQEYARLRDAADENRAVKRWIVGGVAAFVLICVGVWGVFRLVSPQLNLYKANTEREIEVREAKAHRDAAVLLAEAEVNRAKGVAAANELIAESITEEYIRWLYVDQMDQLGDHSVIYIPTEGGIPILEAGRQVQSEVETP